MPDKKPEDQKPLGQNPEAKVDEMTDAELDQVAGGGVVNHEEQYRKPKPGYVEQDNMY